MIVEIDFYDIPPSPGQYVCYPGSGVVSVWHVDKEALARPDWLLPQGCRWFGPLPNDPQRVKVT